jgi:hypothetical protein
VELQMNYIKKLNLILLDVFFLTTWITFSGYGQPALNYHDYVSLTSQLKKMSEKNSNLLKIVSLGQTRSKKDIWLVTLSDSRAGDSDKKPALLVVANLEGNQLVGSEIVLGILENIVNQEKINNSIREVLKKNTIYLIPRLNPDAAERMFLKIKWESENNNSPFDDDNDGTLDEDPVDDLNNDGMITQMRIQDPGGEYITHPDENRLLKKADPTKNEMGIYNVLIEGKDNDGDKEINEDLVGGVDLNRNFPIGYEYFAQGTGLHQVSEPETRALADFLVAHENIVLILTYSANDNLINPPEAKAEEKKSPEEPSFFQRNPVSQIESMDIGFYKYISKKYKEIVGIKSLPVKKEVKGSFTDYGYFGWGIVSLATPGWTVEEDKDFQVSTNTLEVASESKTREEKDRDGEIKTLRWLEKLGVDPFVNWQSLKHPDFPNRLVEVGGFKPFVKTNPPAKIVEKLVPRHSEFILELLKNFPKIEIASIDVEKKEGDLAQIKAIIRNSGFLATNTELGAKMRLNRPTKVELITENQQILSGKPLDFVTRIAGAGGMATFVWTIKGKGKVTLVIDSPKAGIINQVINL